MEASVFKHEYLATKEAREKLRQLRETRNPGVKFPYKCNYCGTLTTLVTEGSWKGTYHCPECGIYQEWSNAFMLEVKK